MSQFEHSVTISELIIRKHPWGWLNEHVGYLKEAWDIHWKDNGLNSPVAATVCFKNKEDAARFMLTWC